VSNSPTALQVFRFAQQQWWYFFDARERHSHIINRLILDAISARAPHLSIVLNPLAFASACRPNARQPLTNPIRTIPFGAIGINPACGEDGDDFWCVFFHFFKHLFRQQRISNDQ
jgi:hypothetical protein